jgi:hypothetical protein
MVLMRGVIAVAGVAHVLLAACGRFGFGESPPDATGLAVRCSWDFLPTFGPIEALSGLNTADYEGDPTLSRDQRTLYYYDGTGLHMARRATRIAPFGPREDIPTQIAWGGDNGLFVRADGVDALLAVPVTASNYDIQTASRADASAPFGTPSSLSELDTAANEFNARLSPDEQWLVFLRWLVVGDATSGRLFMAHRQGVDWVDVQQVFPNATAVEESGSFIGDSLHIVFGHDQDLYTASRPTEADPFGPPMLLADLASPGWDGIPFASDDGCELLFVSDRAGGLGGTDLYHVFVQP